MARDAEENARRNYKKAEKKLRQVSENCQKKNCDDLGAPKLERKVNKSIIDRMEKAGIDVHEVKGESSRYEWYQTKNGDVYTTRIGNPQGTEAQPVWDNIRNQPLNIRFYSK
jgi:hypothetical protein